MNSFSKRVRIAIDSEFPGASPAASVWQGIEASLPTPRPARPRLAARLVPTAVAAILAFSLAGVALASTPQGRAAIDWAFGRFGIRLEAVTSDTVQPEPVTSFDAPGISVTQGVNVPWQGPERLQAMLPTGMRLPAYLPKGFEQPRVNVGIWRSGASVNFSTSTDQRVLVEYHSSAFPRGSWTGTNGEAQDVHEVKVDGKTALAYRDNSGWTVTWARYGHQYGVQTNISLEETMKIAESIK